MRGIEKKPPRRGSKDDLRKRTYTSWMNMLQRCYNPKHVSYPEYGGRGILVTKRWTMGGDLKLDGKQAFVNFVADLGMKPTWKHTLDRKDPNGHYVPSNVKWSTPKEQGVNKRDTHFVRHPDSGLRIAAATLADQLGISYQQLRARMMSKKTWFLLREEAGVTDRLIEPGGKSAP